jgi:hypothetical protein
MARVAWSFNGYSWPINPEEDSTWIKEHIVAETGDVGAENSNIQFGGKKSARRQVSGWIWGPGSTQLLLNMHTWHANKVRANLVDHVGESRRCILLSFSPKPVKDVKEWRQGRQTYQYNAEFIEA